MTEKEIHSIQDTNLIFVKEECVYTKCYCEENVWKLCEHVKDHHSSQLGNCYCVFISNKHKTIPLWQQKASSREDTLVIWDYHVIFIFSPPDTETLVYDLDTMLTFPCDFKTYFLSGIRSNQSLQPQYHRFFRVIPAAVYLQTFASDRSHMLNKKGEYLQPPPVYPCIKTNESDNNIHDFISMDPEVGFGTVVSLSEFVSKFHNNSKKS